MDPSGDGLVVLVGRFRIGIVGPVPQVADEIAEIPEQQAHRGPPAVIPALSGRPLRFPRARIRSTVTAPPPAIGT
ncbi:hypothetical protein GCM10023201_20540 [Actinomycetospora corticicola]